MRIQELSTKNESPSRRLPGAGIDVSSANENDPRWQLAQRIAASGSLGRSRLLADFLIYIVDRHIRDRAHEMTEQQIGVLVFGREQGYDSNDDNIVRSYARNLRKRIDEYFATEGKEESLLLEIPRGGYVPIFSARMETAESRHDGYVNAGNEDGALIGTQTLAPAVSHILSPDSMLAVGRLAKAREVLLRPGMLLALLVGILLGFGSSLLKHVGHPLVPSVEAASDTLWSQLFSGDRDTFIVPSDDGLVIMQDLAERPVPLANYVDGSYRTNVNTDSVPGGQNILRLGSRRYTSVVDLDLVAHVAQLKEVVPGRMMIRYARDLRIDDLRSGNAILIGSEEANPWIELFHSQLNFRLSFSSGPDKSPMFTNLHPRSGENAVYANDGEKRTYGLIAYLPNLNSTGHVLVIAGLNMAGTQAAGTFLLTPSLIMSTLQHARTANGSLQPFELLVEAGNVAANASTPHLVLERIGPP